MKVFGLKIDGRQDVLCRWDYEGNGAYCENWFKNNPQGAIAGGRGSCVLMQDTGLSDKVWPIFEGDICSTEKGIVSIVWNDGGFELQPHGWAPQTPDSDFRYRLSRESIRNLGLSVIGNIYENPDLLPAA